MDDAPPPPLLPLFREYAEAARRTGASRTPHNMLDACRRAAAPARAKRPETRLWYMAPTREDLGAWRGVLLGAPGTPHEGAHYEFTLVLGAAFPFRPPRFRFSKRALPYHPNIDTHGRVHADIFQADVSTRWSPAMHHPDTLLTMLVAFLGEPVARPCARVAAGRLCESDRAEYEARVRRAARQSRRHGLGVLRQLRRAEAQLP